MVNKPSSHLEYSEEDITSVRRCCLYLATKLGDLSDDIVIVGGLVPSLLIEQAILAEGTESYSPFATHAGTRDLDLGLALSILDRNKYTELTERLRNAGFSPDENSQGNQTYQRWRLIEPVFVTVDFLIEPSDEDDRGGTLRHIERDFAAIIIPGLHLAFEDRKSVRIDGYTILEERASRDVWVCGAGAFIVLKALAFEGRGESKDAYDLVYMLNATMFDESSLGEIRSFFSKHRTDSYVQDALDIIRRDFTRHDGVGPTRVALFLRNEPDNEIQADASGLAVRLLSEVDSLE